jgi:DNA-binding response OmpR family regulator
MRILLAEDEPDIGHGIQQILNREGHITDWVTDGIQAWECLKSNLVCYDLAVLDWMIPGISGLEICQKLQQSHYPTRVLMLTAKDTIDDRIQGLDAGADDYLVKPFKIPELLARVRSIQRRLVHQPAVNILQVGNLVLDRDTLSIYSSPAPNIIVNLYAKDFLLLEYLMHHANLVVNRDQIAAALLLDSDQDPPSPNLITVRIKILRQRLAEIGFGDAIESVYGLGYRLISDVLDGQ